MKEFRNELVLTKSQQKALDAIILGLNVFVSGVAGVGKTWILKNLHILLKQHQAPKQEVYLFAATGMGAIMLGGATIGSKKALKLGKFNDSDQAISSRLTRGYIPQGSIIVIDEVGMLSEEQFRQIDVALRACGDRNKSLGGYQVIIGGDFGQMPSDIKWGTPLRYGDYIQKFQVIELVENVRQQSDQNYFDLLNNVVREKGLTRQALNYVHQHHNPKSSGITLVATRTLMDELNNTVPVPEVFYTCTCPDEDTDQPYDSINVWPGMPVILTRNNARSGYCNGDMAVVTEIDFNQEERPVRVRINRTGTEVWIGLETQTYEFCIDTKPWTEDTLQQLDLQKYKPRFLHDAMIIETYEERSYSYLPMLPALYLSPRRVQGVTLESGVIHSSVVLAKPQTNDDREMTRHIQYTVFSRFTTLRNVKVEGLRPDTIMSKLIRKARHVYFDVRVLLLKAA